MVGGEKVNYGRIFSDYKDELELALIQNSAVECELYSIIASVLRESESGRAISLRDVSARRTTKNSKYLKGESGFPDFVVLEREKRRNARILGCVEIKRPDVKLVQNDQIDGHIMSYKKVIYTNGLLWRFYDNNGVEEYELGKFIDGAIKWNVSRSWFVLLNKIDSFKWI